MHYPRVSNEALTLKKAVTGMSLARFGDGELRLCRGESSISQKWSAGIQTELRRILTEGDNRYLPCIPNLNPNELEDVTPRHYFWSQYEKPRYTHLYNPDTLYGSSFVTRPDNAPWIDRESYWEQFEGLWRHKRVLLAAGILKSLIRSLPTPGFFVL